MVNNITIADKSRIAFLISMMVKYGINVPTHYKKVNGFYNFSFDEAVSFVALSNFVRDFNSHNRGMLEIDWDANEIFVQLPSMWD